MRRRGLRPTEKFGGLVSLRRKGRSRLPRPTPPRRRLRDPASSLAAQRHEASELFFRVRGAYHPGMRLYDYAASANCYKARLLLALLGREYERVPIDIFGGDTLTDEYARINPFRSTPALEIAPGDVLVESNAI